MFFFFILAAILTILAAFDALVGGSLRPLVFWYSVTGWAWYRYEKKKSRADTLVLFLTNARPWVYLILLWPLVCVVRSWESLGRRLDVRRFTVLSADRHENFGSWSAAITHARAEAVKHQKAIALFDNAKLRRLRFAKDLSPAMYNVTPAGKVVRCFSRWR